VNSAGLAISGSGSFTDPSQMALQPLPYLAAYAASKAFVLSSREALTEELRGDGRARDGDRRERGHPSAGAPPAARATAGRGARPINAQRPDGP